MFLATQPYADPLGCRSFDGLLSFIFLAREPSTKLSAFPLSVELQAWSLCPPINLRIFYDRSHDLFHLPLQDNRVTYAVPFQPPKSLVWDAFHQLTSLRL